MAHTYCYSELNDPDIVKCTDTGLLSSDGMYPCRWQCGFYKEMNIPILWLSPTEENIHQALREALRAPFIGLCLDDNPQTVELNTLAKVFPRKSPHTSLLLLTLSIF